MTTHPAPLDPWATDPRADHVNHLRDTMITDRRMTGSARRAEDRHEAALAAAADDHERDWQTR